MKKADECFNLIHSLEEDIRRGEFHRVQTELKNLTLKQFPRETLANLANISRRVGLNNKAIEILNKIVRPESRRLQPATDKEKSEYAVALQRIGAVKEARDLLEEVDENTHPEKLLYMAFCCFAQWDYRDAITLLESYIQQDSLTPYQKMVGKVNLSAALINESHLKRAEELLKKLSDETTKGNHTLLHGNIMELSAQVAVHQAHYSKANEFLNRALKDLKNAASTDLLFVKKWIAVVDSHKMGGVSDSLLEVKAYAEEVKHWETIRHCDFFIATINNDIQILEKVYFGSPYKTYRSKILERISEKWTPKEFYLWETPTKTKRKKPVFELELSSDSTGKIQIPPGQLMHQLLILFCHDFYKPLNLGRIHSFLFPEDYFNPFSSPERIYQLIKRLRQTFSKLGVDLNINTSPSGYHLIPDTIAFNIPRTPMPFEGTQAHLRKVTRLTGESFSAKSLRTEMNLSVSSTTRLLKAAIEKGLIQKIGNGPNTKYQIITK